MNFEAHIKELRKAADGCLKEAQKHQTQAEHHQGLADAHTANAKTAEELARGWDLLADALATGKLGAEGLRAIIAGMTADAPAPPLSETPLAVAFGAAEAAPAPAPTFALGDLVNVADGNGAIIVGRTPGRPYEGLRGVVVHVAEDRVAMAFDTQGSTLTLPPSQLMHHKDWLALDDPEGLLADESAGGAP